MRPFSRLASLVAGSRNPLCAKAKSAPGPDVKAVLNKHALTPKGASTEEFCAAHLASLCETALSKFKETGKGMLLPYEGLVKSMKTKVIPDHFKVELSAAGRERIDAIGGVYSKARTPGKEWVDDSEKKQERASSKVVQASDDILRPVYNDMVKAGRR